MKKFIKGTFELELNVADLVAFEEQHKVAINGWIDWANRFGVALNLGTSDDNTYLCEYKIVGATASYCKGLASELRQMIKSEFPKTRSLWQGSGDILF